MAEEIQPTCAAWGERDSDYLSAPIREKEEVEKINPETNEPILKANGQPETEIIEHVIPRFKVATVFDVSQTEGSLYLIWEGRI